MVVIPEIFLVSALRALVEVAGLALLGQGVLYFLAGSARERNPVYQLFAIVTRPVIALVRRLTPRLVVDRHIPAVTLFLLFWLWIGLAIVRRMLCHLHQLTC